MNTEEKKTDNELRELRVKVAELCGWRKVQNEEKLIFGGGDETPDYIWIMPVTGRNPTIADQDELTDYPNSMDAMHEAEKLLTHEQCITYHEQLDLIQAKETSENQPASYPADEFWLHASAVQRAQAFVAVMEVPE